MIGDIGLLLVVIGAGLFLIAFWTGRIQYENLYYGITAFMIGVILIVFEPWLTGWI